LAEVAAKHSADVILPYKKSGHFRTTDTIIAIGASTGGTEAIKVVLESMPADAPGIVIAQHIPEAFSGPFAERMNRTSAMTVIEARDGQQIIPGHVYIAPGSHHLLVERDGARYVCRLSDGEPVNRHRPSVDVLFRSVAQNAGKNAIGVILTGMGADGAKGLKEIQDTGAKTIAQDEASSVVWGMPGEAVKMGAADQILSLERVAPAVLEIAKKMA
jgi:two-component system chemotaxis response regulator CheB